MKRLKGILGLVLCTTVTMCITAIPTFAAESNTSSVSFEYALQPGMEGWGQLNHGERVLASQIPKEILESMTTDGSYKLKSSNSPTATGQKAYYPGSGKEHSGNVIRLSGNKIRSKWGQQSVVEHSTENCPYFFIPLSVKFYGR